MDTVLIGNLRPGFAERIGKVREDIADCCRAAGRSTEEITLVGVSKVFPPEYAAAAYSEGLTDLGENKVQDLTSKIEILADSGMTPNWHMIGTLQKNKVKYIVGKTYLIHSVNTLELAAEISKRSVCNNVTTKILIQANVSGEESKHGFAPGEVKDAVEQMAAMGGIELCGLMTMAPIQQYDGEARGVFASTYELFEALKSYVPDKDSWKVLSMGMSQDYRYAILEGATHIRIGTAIFGDRASFIAG